MYENAKPWYGNTAVARGNARQNRPNPSRSRCTCVFSSSVFTGSTFFFFFIGRGPTVRYLNYRHRRVGHTTHNFCVRNVPARKIRNNYARVCEVNCRRKA
jgi:hypothetical protein